MKKVLYFAALAVLVLPLVMMSCKDRNNPDDKEGNPEDNAGTEEWFDKWTEGDEDDAVKIDPKNLKGIWRWMVLSDIVEGEETPINGYDYTDDEDRQYYLDMGEKKYKQYEIELGALIRNEGEWELIKDTINFNPSSSNGLWSYLMGDYKITLLEENRMVLCRKTDNTSDNLKDKTVYQYRVFTRIDKLPEMPVSVPDRLVANPWRVVSDSIFTFIYAEGGEKIVEVQAVNPLAKNSILCFYALGNNFQLLDANGNILATAKWGVRQAFGNFMLLDISEHGNPSDEDVYPGLLSSLEFWPDEKDATKAKFEHMEFMDQVVEGESLRKMWRYYVEAVK